MKNVIMPKDLPVPQPQNLFLGALPFMLSLAAVCLLAALAPHWGWSVVSTGIFLSYIAVYAQRAPFSLALTLDFLFFRLTTLLSGIGISMGSFMSEINLIGRPSAAFPLLALIYVIFSLIAASVLEKPVRNIAAKHLPTAPSLTTKWWVWPMFGFVTLVLLYVIAVGSTRGFPLFTGMDRFIWRGMFEGDRVFGFFFSNRALIGILLGLVWLRSVGPTRLGALGVFLAMLGTSFLIGEKFTSIVLMLIGFILPWLVNHSITNPWQDIRRFLAPTIKIGSLITVLTIPAVLFSYGFGENSEAAVDTLLQRVSGQAQLWEAVSQDNPPLFNYNSAVVALDKKLVRNPDNDLAASPPYAGIYYLMAAYMPLKAFDAYLLKGISLTMGFEPYILTQYGWLGMLLPLAFFAVIYALHLIYLGFALVKADIIRLALILKLMVWVNFGLQQGDFWFIISTRNMSIVVLILIYEVWNRTAQEKITARLSGNVSTNSPRR